MNSKYELWTRWHKEDWKFHKSGNDLEELKALGEGLSKSLPLSYKLFKVKRTEVI